MVKKDSESDGYYEGVKKFDWSFADFDAFDWSFADFDARMNDLDMEIESRPRPGIGLRVGLGSGAKKATRAPQPQIASRGGERRKTASTAFCKSFTKHCLSLV